MSQEYDKYECKLSDELKNAALKNLREDENVRSQALDQFREWIEKHPKIKKCRMDASFLMRFLRTKKFSVPDACQLLEKYLTTRKVLPELFDKLSLDDKAINQLITSGVAVLLPEPDKQGRLVITYDPENFNVKKYTTVDAIRVTNFLMELANLDERSQICGIAHVVNFEKVTLSHIGMWPITQIKNFTRCWQKTFPIRHGAFFFVNLPAFAVAFSKLVISCFTEKLRSRVHMVKNWESVYEDLGASTLPKEYGGKIPQLDMAKRVLDLAEKHREEILALNDFDIEVSNNDVNFGNSYDADLDSAIVGSFRKIQVD